MNKIVKYDIFTLKYFLHHKSFVYTITILKPRNIPSKNPRDQPIKWYHDLVLQAHTLCQIRRSPENPRRSTFKLITSILMNRSPSAKIRHSPPVAELERRCRSTLG